MIDTDTDRKWYLSLAQYADFNETAMHAVLAHLGIPDSVLDLGCGDGSMLAVAYEAGCRTVGIERSEAGYDVCPSWNYANVLIRDLAQPVQLYERFELVMCIEVGEHLHDGDADTLADNIAQHASHYVVFTAAAPNQGGDGHINCQPQDYWRVKLEARGLRYDSQTTHRLKYTWDYTTGPMFWLPQNLQVFEVVTR